MNTTFLASHPLRPKHKTKNGFTLLELSIVLVIIGLIVGGVIVGRELIKAAEIRGTLSQIDKYKTAANIFEMKYNCIPGDCAQALTLGFTSDATFGIGDGNGSVTVLYHSAGVAWPFYYNESYNFWYHLAAAGLLDYPAAGYLTGSTVITAGKLPPAKIGNGNYIGAGTFNFSTSYSSKQVGNVLHTVGSIAFNGGACNASNCDGGMTALEASTMDSKADDGLPMTGKVMLFELDGIAPATVGNACRGTGNTYDLTGTWYSGSSNGNDGKDRPECALAFTNGF